MAAKIKLNLDPDDDLDFEWPVEIPQAAPGKKPLKVTFRFKHRNRLQVAELFDGYIARAVEMSKEAEAKEAARKAAEEAGDTLPEEPRKSMAELAKEAIARDIAVLNDIAVGWNIDAPFDEEHLTKFFTKYPGAGNVIANTYRVSCMEGRLGNSAP